MNKKGFFEDWSNFLLFTAIGIGAFFGQMLLSRTITPDFSYPKYIYVIVPVIIILVAGVIAKMYE